jgi:hypothetical protein
MSARKHAFAVCLRSMKCEAECQQSILIEVDGVVVDLKVISPRVVVPSNI